MRKENVFLVTGRTRDQRAVVELQQRVICAKDERELVAIERSFPDFAVAGVANLAVLEATVTAIKLALRGDASAPALYVAPGVA